MISPGDYSFFWFHLKTMNSDRPHQASIIFGGGVYGYLGTSAGYTGVGSIERTDCYEVFFANEGKCTSKVTTKSWYFLMYLILKTSEVNIK